jgi:hypothetical protein
MLSPRCHAEPGPELDSGSSISASPFLKLNSSKQSTLDIFHRYDILHLKINISNMILSSLRGLSRIYVCLPAGKGGAKRSGRIRNVPEVSKF